MVEFDGECVGQKKMDILELLVLLLNLHSDILKRFFILIVLIEIIKFIHHCIVHQFRRKNFASVFVSVERFPVVIGNAEVAT